jgi:threonine dehydrogenase-like Zn-dependent dehydrogenase
MEALYGHRTAGIFGYSHLTGGYNGGQAEFVRVPNADVDCLKIEGSRSDEHYLFLSDIACTGWHAGKLPKAQLLWFGAVDLLVPWHKCGQNSGVLQESLELMVSTIASKWPKEKIGAEVFDFRQEDVIKSIQKILPGGSDVCIDAVGFRFPKSWLHKIERAVRLETDAPQILSEALTCVRKGGIVSCCLPLFHW